MSELSSHTVCALQRAISHAERVRARMSKVRRKFLEAYAGRHFLMSDDAKSSPIPLLYTSVAIYIAQLVAQHPAAAVSSKFRKYRPFGRSMQIHLAGKARELDMRKRMRRAVFDSMFGVGITYAGVHQTGEVLANGAKVAVGRSYVSNISLDHYVQDPGCRDIEEALWQGHLMELPIEGCRDQFDNMDNVTISTKSYADGDASERLTSGYKEDRRELHDMCQFNLVFYPEADGIFAIPLEGQGEKALKDIEYKGPEEGPYDILGYMPMEGTAWKVPPVTQWHDWHEMINTVACKFREQATDMRKVLAYTSGAADDADRVMQARNGTAVKVDQLDQLAEFTFSEPSQAMQPLLQFLMGIGSLITGNTDLIGGMSASASSATEAALLQSNAAGRINDMRTEIEHFAAGIFKKIAFYEFNDPLLDSTVYKRVRGTDMEFPERLTPDSLEGQHFDYIWSVTPYSMSPKDPAKTAQNILQWVTQFVMPALNIQPALAQQLDLETLVRVSGEKMGIDEVDDFFEARRANPTDMTMAAQAGQGFPTSPSSSPADQMQQMMAQSLGAKMPGMNANQTPSNMPREAVAAAAGA